MKIGIKYAGSDKINFTWKDLKAQIEPSFKEIEIYYKELYMFSRVLSLNNNFVNTYKKIRKKYGFDQFSDKLTSQNLLALKKIDPELFNGIKKASNKGAKEILSKFNIDFRWDYLFINLVIFGYFSPGGDFYWHNAGYYKGDNRFVIEVYHPVSKNYLHKLVENIWKYSGEEINNLPKFNAINISDRDLRIVELRDEKKMKYIDIANQIEKEFKLNNKDGFLNEDSVKTAYKRAKKKITSLNKKR